MNINPKALTITQLLSAESEQYVVPSYQRRYSWQPKQLGELLDDISLLGGAEAHLLGSIVCLTGYHTAGINKLELVDGQQRLSTVCILLHSIGERLKECGDMSAAQEIDRLLEARSLGESAAPKILQDSLDAVEFEQQFGGKILEMPLNKSLAAAFSVFRDWVAKQEHSALKSFLYRLKNQCIVVRLDVSDSKDAFKLFETINNRGLRLSPTDIIKNFILGNAARFNQSSLSLARSKWAEILRHLDGTNIESFFRLFLCARLRRRVTISYVISRFKAMFMQQVIEADILPERNWYSEDELIEDEAEEELENGSEKQDDVNFALSRMPFANFLDELVKFARVYGEIVHAKTGNREIDRHLRNLRMIKSIQSYGFLMALRVGSCSDSDYIQVLELTEAFLMRRHICRKRTNENERMFARLCGIDRRNPLSKVRAEYRGLCPSDESFKHDFAHFDFTANLIDRARYCLEQFELREQGDYLEMIVGGSDTVHVEHIIPQKIKTKKAKEEYGDWASYLGAGSEAKHPHFISRIGNMTLVAGLLNIKASNHPYEGKKNAYRASAIKQTNSIPDRYEEFGFAAVEDRSNAFAEIAVTLWPIP